MNSNYHDLYEQLQNCPIKQFSKIHKFDIRKLILENANSPFTKCKVHSLLFANFQFNSFSSNTHSNDITESQMHRLNSTYF